MIVSLCLRCGRYYRASVFLNTFYARKLVYGSENSRLHIIPLFHSNGVGPNFLLSFIKVHSDVIGVYSLEHSDTIARRQSEKVSGLLKIRKEHRLRISLRNTTKTRWSCTCARGGKGRKSLSTIQTRSRS
jgi:hypothetical protein